MRMQKSGTDEPKTGNRSFARGLWRGFGGGLPLLLVGLSYFQGFKRTFDLKDDLLDAFVAYGVGFLVAAALLPLFSIIEPNMSLNEIVGKLALQAVPGSIGVLLTHGQLGGPKGETRQKCKT